MRFVGISTIFFEMSVDMLQTQIFLIFIIVIDVSSINFPHFFTLDQKEIFLTLVLVHLITISAVHVSIGHEKKMLLLIFTFFWIVVKNSHVTFHTFQAESVYDSHFTTPKQSIFIFFFSKL